MKRRFGALAEYVRQTMLVAISKEIRQKHPPIEYGPDSFESIASGEGKHGHAHDTDFDDHPSCECAGRCAL